jgi:hypothetical protein
LRNCHYKNKKIQLKTLGNNITQNQGRLPPEVFGQKIVVATHLTSAVDSRTNNSTLDMRRLLFALKKPKSTVNTMEVL